MQLTRLRFVGCDNSAVVVEPDAFMSGEERQRVDFDQVEFSKNGRVKDRTSGAAVNARRCPEQPCRRLSLRFLQCQFVDNRGSDGGAIFAEDADVEIRKSTFEGNEATGAGGAIYTNNGRTAALTIEDSEFAKNKAWGSEELEAAACRSVLTSNVIELARGTGGAIFAYTPTSVDILASTFVQNTGCSGGGAIAVLQMDFGSEENSRPASFSVTDSIFQDNAAYCGSQRNAMDFMYYNRGCSKGGALVYEALDESPASWTFRNSTFLGNRAIVGGAMHLTGLGSSVAEHKVVSCDFDENTAIRSGGAMYLKEVRMTIASSTFANGRAFYGGHILMIGPTHLRTERDPNKPEAHTVLADAVAYFGGAVLTTNEGSLFDLAVASATASCLFAGSFDLSALVVRNNIAYGSGGGFSVRDASLTPVFRDVLIENNSAILGGGIEIVSSPNITFDPSVGTSTIIRNNTAAVGGGIRYLIGRFWFSGVKASRAQFQTQDIEAFVLADETRQSHWQQGVADGLTRDAEDHRRQKTLRSLFHRRRAIPGLRRSARPPECAEILHKDRRRQRRRLQSGTRRRCAQRHRRDRLPGCAVRRQRGRCRRYEQTGLEFSLLDGAGGMSAHMKDFYWNRSNKTSCFPALFGAAACQRFSFHNVTVVQNRAEYAGGIFCSIPNCIAFSCSPTNQTKLVISELNTAAISRGVIQSYCSDVHLNEGLGRVNGEGANGGSKAVYLSVVGHEGPLKTVASGEKLAIPCEDERNASCASELRIAIKDMFDQTITRGIADANLTLALISEAITGGLRYTAVKGVATIDSTFAWGIGVEDTLTIVSEHDPKIRLDIPFSTRECFPGETTVGKECSRCPQEFYGFDPSLPCLPCESGAECGGGAAMVPEDGQWHSNPFSPAFRKCIKATACAYSDRKQKLEAFHDDSARVQEALRDLQRDSGEAGWTAGSADYPVCSEGYRGFLCGSCASGYGHSYTGDCEKCPSRDSSAVLFFLSSLWLFVIIGINSAITVTSMRSTVERVNYERSSTLRDRRTLFRRMGHIQRAEAVMPRRTSLSKGTS